MREAFELVNSMAPYLLLGFLLAGIMHAFVPAVIYRKYLGRSDFRTVLNASLLGIPLPLCSCGVLPTAMSLRKEGASKAATISFLISTPQTGVDSIIATYSLMGLPFALLRPVVALATSLAGGFMVGMFDEDNVADTGMSSPSAAREQTSFTRKLRKAIEYAFVELIQNIGKWLIAGLLVAGLITVFVPDTCFAVFAGRPFLSMLLVMGLAVPMYICATGSIPIATALMLKGLSPGTALVLLIAGPAVNVASMFVVSKVMGKKTLFVYLFSIIVCAILLGLGVDYLLPREWFTEHLADIRNCREHGLSYFNTGCLILLAVLLCNAFIRKRKGSGTRHCSAYDELHGDELRQKNKWEFVVTGMRCSHCASNVKNAILKIAGVEIVEVTLSNGNVIVFGEFDRDALVKSVRDMGFGVTQKM